VALFSQAERKCWLEAYWCEDEGVNMVYSRKVSLLDVQCPFLDEC